MTNHCLLLTAVAAVLLAATSANQPRTILTAYNMLQQYGFPPGILPEGVQDCLLRPDDGSFEAHFSNDCHVRIDHFSLHYSTRLAGFIQNGTINYLEGVTVKIVIPWIPIRKVSRDGDRLRIYLQGVASKSFPVDDFSVSPQCH